MLSSLHLLHYQAAHDQWSGSDPIEWQIAIPAIRLVGLKHDFYRIQQFGYFDVMTAKIVTWLSSYNGDHSVAISRFRPAIS